VSWQKTSAVLEKHTQQYKQQMGILPIAFALAGLSLAVLSYFG
jgi:hypothetical protein